MGPLKDYIAVRRRSEQDGGAVGGRAGRESAAWICRSGLCPPPGGVAVPWGCRRGGGAMYGTGGLG